LKITKATCGGAGYRMTAFTALVVL